MNTGVLWGNIVGEYWYAMREYCGRILVCYEVILWENIVCYEGILWENTGVL